MRYIRVVFLLLVIVGALFGVVEILQSPSVVYTENELLVIVHPQPVTVLVMGDMMLDRSVRTRIDRDGLSSLFAFVSDWIMTADIAFANAEGVFTDLDSISQIDSSILRFTFNPTTLPVLHDLGFDFLGQANNHTADFGKTSLNLSRANIKTAGMIPVGDYFNEFPGPEYRTIRDTTIAFVAYNQFGYNLDRVLTAIAEGQAHSDFVIVVPHWGEEYTSLPTPGQQQVGRKFIDAGADVVIGMHPHVVQSIEQYKNKLIFYSIGNFIFDQSFSAAVSEAFAVQIAIDTASVSYTLLPYRISQAVPKPLSGDSADTVIKKIQLYSEQIGFMTASSSMIFARE